VDDVADARLGEALLARTGEGVVEVRSDLPLCAGIGERVAGAALLDEQLLAVLLVGGSGLEAARSAPGGEQRSGPERGQEEGAAARRTPVEVEVHVVPSSSRYEKERPLAAGGV
jgi:hypothetical protein